jgi:hypothetical protein
MSYLPLQLNTSRAELVEVIRDGATTEFLHDRVLMGDRDVVLVINLMVRGLAGDELSGSRWLAAR